MRSLFLLVLVPLAAACTSVAPAEPGNGGCTPDALARYSGQTANDALAERMKRETGRTALRWVQPGMAVTMDYREDRLTVYLDSSNRVERASCS